MRVGILVALIAQVAACGDDVSMARFDAAPSDGSLPADATRDGPSLDAAPVCDLDPGLPAPPSCAQSLPWAAYIGDELVNGRADVFLVRMDGTPGAPALASGGIRVLQTHWSISPNAAMVAFSAGGGAGPWRLHGAPITSAGPGEVRELSGPFTADGTVTWWAWSPDGSKIAYIADQEQERGRELWVLDLASGGPAQRVNAPFESPGGSVQDEVPLVPTWSPDSSMLLFRAGYNAILDEELYVADVSGAMPLPPVALTNDHNEKTPDQWVWSPDSRAVAFRQIPSGFLHAARVACGAIVDGPHLVSSQVSLGEVLSPDGHEMLYVARLDPDTAALFRADLTVSPPASFQISEAADIRYDSVLAWSPTAPRVAIQTRGQLQVLDGTTGVRSVVNGPLVDGGQVVVFAWSPDGQSIAYRANELDVDQMEIFHVDMSGSAPAPSQRVSLREAHDVWVGNPWWSPDSSHLAYTANQDQAARGELYVASRADGVMGTPVRLNQPLQRDGARVYPATWSPEGSRLLYGSNDAGDTVFDVFVVGLEAPGVATPINGGPDAFDARWAPCPAP
jgi:Tol biopolymer transport system component